MMVKNLFQRIKETFTSRPQPELDIHEEFQRFQERRESFKAMQMENIREIIFHPVRAHRAFLGECDTNLIMFRHEWDNYRYSLRSQKRLDVTSKRVTWRLKRMRDDWEEHFFDTCSCIKDRLDLICKLEGAEKDTAMVDLANTLGTIVGEKAQQAKPHEDAELVTHSRTVQGASPILTSTSNGQI